jgi:molybdate transport system substrate-binding protein
MTNTVTIISSMATRQILSELVTSYSKSSQIVRLESVGGVEAARRIRAGETFDIVVLAAEAIAALCAEGYLVHDSVRVFAHSPTAMAVPTGAPRPEQCDEAAIRLVVSGAKRIALSTGPSGKSMTQLLQHWNAVEYTGSRIIQAPPGVPVARLLAGGEADVGFQQLSELLGEPGIEIVGPLPQSLQPMTVFSAGISRNASDIASVRRVIDALVSESAAAAKRRGGMEPGS